MKNVYGCLSIASLCLFTLPSFAEVSCGCPKLGCDPCSYQQSIKFYTEKCGPDDAKLKSCARPTCIAVEEATKECPVPPAASSSPREPIVVKPVDSPKDSEVESEVAASVGKVKVIQGSVSIVHADGQRSVVTKDTDLHEGETVESGSDGMAVVHFEGGNKLHVHPDTAVAVKEFKNPQIEASRKALLNLIKGKIRNQVEQKYNGKTSYYKIMTKAAVAGVRGTDFIIETSDDGGKLETKVETLKGKVILASLDEKHSLEILRGEGAKFANGSLGPVYKISDEQMKELESNSRVDVARRKSKKESTICQKPAGMFNQCAWKCVNNPSGESKCRVDLPKVTCTRERCNGNGVWAEETRLPDPAVPIMCPATGFLVKDCDY